MAVAAYPGALLILALALAFLIATNKTYQYTFGVLLAKLADVFHSIEIGIPHIGHIGLGAVGDAVDSLNNFILRKIGEGIEALQAASLFVWHQMIAVIQELGTVVGNLGEDTEKALRILRRYTIPGLLGAAIGPVGLLVGVLRAQVAALLAAGAHAVTVPAVWVKSQIAGLARRVVALERAAVKAATVTIPHAISFPLPRITDLERAWAAIRPRLGRLEKIGTVAGLTAITVSALSKLGLGWTRCSKVGRLGKAVCGMDEGLLEDLLTGALVVASSISVVELARECQAFTGEVNAGVRFFVRELR